MSDRQFADQLAPIAHELWCRRMREEGWRHGPVYDADAKEHDALVPYEQLSRHDRREVRSRVHCEDIEQLLADAVEYSRGPARDFIAEEMRSGVPVAFVVAGGSGEEVPGEERGVIESWARDGEGELKCVRVRWDDGEMVEYDPSERVLWRVNDHALSRP